MEHNSIIILAVIIILSKLLSDLFYRVTLPSVLALILIGLIIGPTGLNLVQNKEDFEILKIFGEIGVVILLFIAGLETDIVQMKRIGKNSLYIALGGVFVPLIAGYCISLLVFKNHYQALLLGTVLTATSVSISVMTLMDLNKLNTTVGNIILSAAIIDDVIGILILTFVLGMGNIKGNAIIATMGIIFLYLLGASLVGIFVIPFVLNFANKLHAEKSVLSVSLAILFLFSWTAHKVEIASITGAYIAGVFIGSTEFKNKVEEGMHTIGHTIFIALFFVFIGLETNLRIGKFNVLFIFLFILTAIMGKILGPVIISKFLGYNWITSVRIGCGMVPRGEVALVVAAIALREGVFVQEHFSAVVLMVITTAFLTPLLLKLLYRNKKSREEINAE